MGLIQLSNLISEKTKVLRNDSLILFKTVNMALFDASIGNYVYKKAENLGIGQDVNIYEYGKIIGVIRYEF
ncbi:hypothetical protein [Peribacillus simplex]|uniref:hypothetical protein n=1 Tax=Peribacillus simplex TaxID=1478 RepID=UPI003D2E397F